MSTLPCVRLPEAQVLHNTTIHPEPPPSPSPRSKLKAFFSWRKPTTPAQLQVPSAGEQCNDLLLAAKDRHGSASPRRSPTWRVRRRHTSTKAQQSPPPSPRPRSTTLLDPPPMFQAYSRALIHATLEVPLSASDKFHSGRSSRDGLSSSHGGPAVLEADSAVESVRGHRRFPSASSTYSLAERVFILHSNGYVLQYSMEGDGDRLPEKMLELSTESVAFASDAIPGRHWVLQVSTSPGSADDIREHLKGPKWPRVMFHPHESMKTVETLLLVFDDPEELCAWLLGIRKEIENLAGAVLRPESRGRHSRSKGPRPDSVRQSRLETDTQRFSQSASILPLGLSEDVRATRSSGRLETPPIIRSQSAHSAASSLATTMLSSDRLRESVTSDEYASTVATSFEGSASSMSPTMDNFPPYSVAREVMGSKALRKTGSLNRTSPWGVRAGNPAGRTIQERRKAAASLLQIQSNHTSVTQAPSLPIPREKSLPSTPQPESSPSTGRPLSVLAPLPDLEVMKKTSKSRQQRLSEEPGSKEADELQTYSATPSRPVSRLRGKGGLHEKDDGAPKPRYSLFPKRISSTEVKPEPLISPSWVEGPFDASLRLEGSPTRPPIPRLSPPREKPPSPKARTTRSKTLTLVVSQRPASERLVSSLLPPTTASDFDKPQRSPAVTDEMIAYNFGAMPTKHIPSPVDQLTPPESSRFGSDARFRPSVGPRNSMPSWRDETTRQYKTPPVEPIPSTHNKDGSIQSIAPIGPPPSGPLPDLPTGITISRTEKAKPPGQRLAHSFSYGHNARAKKTRSIASPLSQVDARSHADSLAKETRARERSLSALASHSSRNSSSYHERTGPEENNEAKDY